MWYNAWESIGDLNKLISKNYGMKVYACEPMRKIMKLTTDQGVKALKIVNSSYDRYIFVCEAMEYARHNGYCNIPKIIQTRDDKMGAKTKNGILIMNDWIDSREINFESDLDLKLATEALAQLHLASQGFKPSKEANPRNMWGKWIRNLNHRCKEMRELEKIAKSKKKKSDFDEEIIKYTDYFYDVGKKSIQNLEKSDYYRVSEQYKKKSTFCHNDLGSANMLLTKSNDVFFIDFDNCTLDMTIHDLASFILKNIQYRQLDMNRVYLILKTYQKENAVSEAEIEIIKAFMEFPHEFWEFGVRYYKRAKKYSWTDEKFHNKLSRVIDHIPVMEDFIRKF